MLLLLLLLFVPPLNVLRSFPAPHILIGASHFGDCSVFTLECRYAVLLAKKSKRKGKSADKQTKMGHRFISLRVPGSVTVSTGK